MTKIVQLINSVHVEAGCMQMVVSILLTLQDCGLTVMLKRYLPFAFGGCTELQPGRC